MDRHGDLVLGVVVDHSASDSRPHRLIENNKLDDSGENMNMECTYGQAGVAGGDMRFLGVDYRREPSPDFDRGNRFKGEGMVGHDQGRRKRKGKMGVLYTQTVKI